MFSLAEGPTAIRPAMVRAMAFSLADVEQTSGHRRESVRGALAAVWNGRAGQVVVVVRFVERGDVERYAWTEPIRSESDLEEAIRAGISCAENLGLQMDDAEFGTLSAAEQKARMRRWNELRKGGKPAKGEKPKKAAKPPTTPAKASEPRPKTPEPRPEVAAQRPAESTDKASPRTVLGRVAVVRKRTGEGAGPREAIGRILASY
jgi:hypothetical protein